MGQLEGKIVMVTGASSGIGREICLDLAAAGCRVIAAARRVGRLQSLCAEINGLGPSEGPDPRAVAVELDVSAGESAVGAAVGSAWAAFGRIDSLVNNAGVTGSLNSPLSLPEDEWAKVLATNLTGQWLVAKHVCRRLRDAKVGGSVINISSIAGVNRALLPGLVAYTASKTSLNAITKAMAVELGAYNIRVNSISPGIFKSEITESLMTKKWLSNVVAKTVPLRTLGTADPALTSLVRHLIHDASNYVTGNIFIVDAGTTLPGLPLFSSL